VRAILAFLAGLSLLCARLPAEAQPPGGPVIYPGTPPAQTARPEASGISITGTVFIVALAGAGAWLWWRGRRGARGSGLHGDRRLALAETRPLGNRQYLVVASYDGRKFLLGVCPGRIEMLAPLDPGPPPSP
jgi:flagellar protein FliO/FliZ